MKINSEFLVIENNKAVIKMLDKQIDTYECLMDLKQRIKRLDKEEILRRLYSENLGNKLIISDFFSKEFGDNPNELLKDLASVHLVLFKEDVNSKLKELYDSYEEEAIKFNKIESPLKEIIFNKFFDSAINSINEKYENLENLEKRKFIEEKLKQENIPFCREYRPKGYNRSSFIYKDLEIIYVSNFGYGSASYSSLFIKLNGVLKINSIKDLTENRFLFNKTTLFSLEKAEEEINEYINNPEQYKNQFYKNNIKYLKRLLVKEENRIPLMQNTIIPNLEKRVNELAEKVKEYKKLVSELKDYTEEELNEVKTINDSPNSILGKNNRIQLLKIEINQLINLSKEDDDLMKIV